MFVLRLFEYNMKTQLNVRQQFEIALHSLLAFGGLIFMMIEISFQEEMETIEMKPEGQRRDESQYLN